MNASVVSKIVFTVTFPPCSHRAHIDPMKLHSLARRQLPDGEVIDTIEHLFRCSRCFETYRFIRTAYHAST